MAPSSPRTRTRVAALALGLALTLLAPGGGAVVLAQPALARIGILFLARPESDTSRRALALREGLRELSPEMRSKRLGVQIYTVESPLLDGIASRIAEAAREQRLPSVFPFRETVEGGGLMSYASSFADAQQAPGGAFHPGQADQIIE